MHYFIDFLIPPSLRVTKIGTVEVSVPIYLSLGCIIYLFITLPTRQGPTTCTMSYAEIASNLSLLEAIVWGYSGFLYIAGA